MPDISLHLSGHSARRWKRFRLHGLVASTLLHVLVAGSLLFAAVRAWDPNGRAGGEQRVLYVTTADKPAEPSPEVETRVVSDAAEVTSPMLQEKIDQLAGEAGQRTDAENLERLDELSDRLSDVSSDASIDRMAGAFQSLLGTKSRAERPSEDPVAGEFDLDTAQFHEVRREEKEDGQWRYVCILVDAEGRALEVELTAEEGEPIYHTMQQIKQNPLLERVYRKIAMPLFDKMLAGAQQAARAGEVMAADAEELSRSPEPARQPDADTEVGRNADRSPTRTE